MPALYSFLALFAGSVIAMAATRRIPCDDRMLRLVISLLSIQAFCLVAMLLSLIPLMRRHGIRQSLGMPSTMPSLRESLKHIAFSLLILYPAILLVTPAANWFCRRLNIPIVEQAFAKLPPDAGLPYIVLLVLACVIVAPATEETMMRLILFRAIRSRWRSGAFFLAPAVFAVCHGCPQYTPGLFLVGLALQMAQRKGGLPLSISLHAAYNAISLIMLN